MKKYPMPEDKKVDPTNVSVACIFCNDRFEVEVNASDLKKWNMGNSFRQQFLIKVLMHVSFLFLVFALNVSKGL